MAIYQEKEDFASPQYQQRLKKRLEAHEKTLKHKHGKCDCHKHKHAISRYDSSDMANYSGDTITPLEEHFENFAGYVGDVAESFLGLGKKARERKQARQERRISRIKGGQAVTEAKQKAKIAQLEAQTAQSQSTTLQAQQQAEQTNQLTKQVTPGASPVTPAQTPQGAGTSNDLDKPSYATLPMTEGGMGSIGSVGSLDTEQAPEAKESKGTEAKPIETAPAKKSNKTIYIVVAVVLVVAVYLYMRKKK